MVATTRSTTAPAARNPFRFLDLPPELRNRVYELALHEQDPEPVTFTHGDINKHQPALAYVSQQLRDEALDIWYGCNKFTLIVRVSASYTIAEIQMLTWRMDAPQWVKKAFGRPCTVIYIDTNGRMVQPFRLGNDAMQRHGGLIRTALRRARTLRDSA